ncbi:MAG: bifunctional adenosylcobinamide kinase/adenosylcobinamide-phosphate guanylyltransferase [Stappiaceae bacterium]
MHDAASDSELPAVKSVLVTGGARSGKSAFAEALVIKSGKQRFYLATATAGDEEMESRIKTHQNRRGRNWQTVEEPLEIADTIMRLSSPDAIILIDCLTLWLSNLMMNEMDIDDQVDRLALSVRQTEGPVVFVSNEVGQGIVPDNAMARSFRDHAGRLNQTIGDACDAVYLVAAGQPLLLKPRIQPEIFL